MENVCNFCVSCQRNIILSLAEHDYMFAQCVQLFSHFFFKGLQNTPRLPTRMVPEPLAFFFFFVISSQCTLTIWIKLMIRTKSTVLLLYDFACLLSSHLKLIESNFSILCACEAQIPSPYKTDKLYLYIHLVSFMMHAHILMTTFWLKNPISTSKRETQFDVNRRAHFSLQRWNVYANFLLYGTL